MNDCLWPEANPFTHFFFFFGMSNVDTSIPQKRRQTELKIDIFLPYFHLKFLEKNLPVYPRDDSIQSRGVRFA